VTITWEFSLLTLSLVWWGSPAATKLILKIISLPRRQFYTPYINPFCISLKRIPGSEAGLLKKCLEQVLLVALILQRVDCGVWQLSWVGRGEIGKRQQPFKWLTGTSQHICEPHHAPTKRNLCS
jgi:hypothetical protein